MGLFHSSDIGLDLGTSNVLTSAGVEGAYPPPLPCEIAIVGKSNVGKSSLINNILDCDLLEVGELAKKIKRGKNTTRKTEIFNLNGTYFVDTCGFSMLDTVDVEPKDLRLYYDDFEAFRNDCKFSTCTHTDEPNCAVKEHVGKEIGEGRYQRYLAIYKQLVERKESKYD